MQTVVIYPGRFQPFHRGHGEVYKWLKDKFGNATVATSNKVEEPKSPFNFVEKKKMMMLAGVPSKDIKQVRNPYIAPEVLSKYDGSKTVLIFAVSQKDMDEDPRFSFKPTKSGKPGYLQPYAGNEHNLQPFGDPEKPKGYVVVTPTFTFKILGKPMKSASELRQQFANADTATQKKIITELFGTYDKDVHKMMKEKIKSQSKTLKQIREGIDHSKFGPMLDSFVDFASDHLGLQTKPDIDYKFEGEGRSFGGYSPTDKSIKLVTKNRHPMDIFRTLAHELIHHKQNEDGRLGKDIEKEGATGSDIENEANSEAGKIMRWYAKKNPQAFEAEFVTEGVLTEGINDPGKLKAIFLAGGPGSGKDFVMNSALAGHGLEEINSDNALEHLMKKQGLDLEMPESEREERDIVRGRAKKLTKEKERLALSGRNGLIINGTADDVEKIASIKKQLEDMGYDTMMSFVNTSDDVSRQRNFERGKSGGRKVPDGTNKHGIPDGTKDIRSEKWKLAQENLGKFQAMFGPDRFHVIDNSKDARKVSDDERKEIEVNFNRLRRHARKFVLSPNQNPAAGAWIEQEAQKRGITNYKAPKIATEPASRNSEPTIPVQRPQPAELDQARRIGLSYYGFGRYGRKIQGRNTVTHTSQQGQLTPVQQQVNEDLRKWFREKWVRFDTKGNIKGDCARDPGEGKPKCRPLASAVAMGKEARAKAARRKRREDPVANRKGKGGKPVFVRTEEVLNEKNVPTNPQLWSKAKSLAKSKFDVYPSAYANGWASKWYKSKGGGWKSSGVDEAFTNYMNESNTPSDREWGKPSLTAIYKSQTPGQDLAGDVAINEKKKDQKKGLKKEDNNLPLGYLMPAYNDGLGPTFGGGTKTTAGNPLSGYSVPMQESITNWINKEETQNRFIRKYGNLAEQKLLEAASKLKEADCDSEMIKKPKSIRKIKENIKEPAEMGTVPTQRKDELYEQSLMDIMPRRYLDKFPGVKKDPAKAAQYMKMRAIKHRDALDYESQHPFKYMVGGKREERAERMHEASEDVIDTSKTKTLKGYKKNIHPQSDFEKKTFAEDTPAWQRKEGKNPEGGLNRKGIASYRRENPGSKLSMAVTTKPSKLKKGSKAANRRKSFCARMGGMKKRLTSAKTANDPNSRINKSLRKWNCEE